ncbi:polysaccharide biosynthesis/export family protein [Luteolibacter soli]|uniref:SLBB domain-containing protein n=1 Tax=Luteolibacter soli TaxID=3135280 RepID=A0ABU9AS48_9BACT
MRPWMLQGLAIGCLLTAAAAVVQKETSKATSPEAAADRKFLSERSHRSPSGASPAKLPTKMRGLRKDESYASRMQNRFEEGDHVTVGGQVYSPGPVLVGSSSTLQSVIAKAGGVTPFGALNRVRLTRGATCTEYNLNTAEGRDTAVQSKDTIEVPQKNVIGR